MDAETFKMVDGLLASTGGVDNRQSAQDILESGVRNDSLKVVASVVARRYSLRPESVIEWYAEVLNQQIQSTKAILAKLRRLRKSYARGQ